ncbi:DUF456 domain-containing protein [Aureibaculum algae]|uniref:DUF456 domain-containing protein n=1 Tax=Aureibaculum algae TaxID=2584122 RepID=A0A5B7U0F4_9FLAO|nr:MULTISPECIES: DUF456 domain-containing protein [Aureibaculum]QCX40422.1 DUF456 domain-containing protein [Aureibaculum algae]
MDILLLILGGCLMLLGLIGSFLPILPGPLTGWLGLLVLHLTNAIPMNWTFLGITLGVALLIWVLDYIIPAMGTKKFGGSKSGAIGTTIGLIIGLFSPIPLGFIIGAFVGAFIGEMVFDSTDTKRALKASFGSFLGFLFSTTVKFIISMVFLVFFISKVYDNWSLLIG